MHALELYMSPACVLSVEQDGFATLLNEDVCGHERLDATDDNSNLDGVFNFLPVEHTKLLPLNLVYGVFCQLCFLSRFALEVSSSVSTVDS
jgi:hypothetical protein